MLRSTICSVCVSLLVASIAQAATVYNTSPSPTKANGTFIAGSGIPGNGFAVDTGASGAEVALKARARDTGQPLSQSGNVYYLSPGLASNNVSPWWNFDYQFSPGTLGNPADETYLELQVDFDPTVGAENFVTINQIIGDPDVDPNNSWDESDGYFLNPGGNVWSSNDVPYVVSNSAHLGFLSWAFLGANPPYNPNTPGEYKIVLSAYDDSQNLLASTEILAVVVPEPSSVALAALGVATLGLVAYRRRRKA